jgi:hypothetical protein
MVHNSRSYWLLPSVRRPETQILEDTTFRKPDLFPSSGEGGETPTLSGPLERAHLGHWTTHGTKPQPHALRLLHRFAASIVASNCFLVLLCANFATIFIAFSLLSPLAYQKCLVSHGLSSIWGTQRSRRLPPLAWRRKQIQSPKRRVFQLFRIPDDGQGPEPQRFW